MTIVEGYRDGSKGAPLEDFGKEKLLLMGSMDVKGKPYYSSEFIEESIEIGEKAIYGTAFTLKLKKSALNL